MWATYVFKNWNDSQCSKLVHTGKILSWLHKCLSQKCVKSYLWICFSCHRKSLSGNIPPKEKSTKWHLKKSLKNWRGWTVFKSTWSVYIYLLWRLWPFLVVVRETFMDLWCVFHRILKKWRVYLWTMMKIYFCMRSWRGSWLTKGTLIPICQFKPHTQGSGILKKEQSLVLTYNSKHRHG